MPEIVYNVDNVFLTHRESWCGLRFVKVEVWIP